MKVLIITVADYARVEPQTGKMDILGAFTQILAHKFPIRHRAMMLAVKLRDEMGDSPNPHQLKVEFTNEDGKILANFKTAFNMPATASGVSSEFNAIMEFRNTTFRKPGSFTFYIDVDGEAKGSIDIQVAQIQSQK